MRAQSPPAPLAGRPDQPPWRGFPAGPTPRLAPCEAALAAVMNGGGQAVRGAVAPAARILRTRHEGADRSRAIARIGAGVSAVSRSGAMRRCRRLANRTPQRRPRVASPPTRPVEVSRSDNPVGDARLQIVYIYKAKFLTMNGQALLSPARRPSGPRPTGHGLILPSRITKSRPSVAIRNWDYCANDPLPDFVAMKWILGMQPPACL